MKNIAINQKTTVINGLLISLFFVFFFASSVLANPDNKNIDSPNQPGPYNVGLLQTTVPLTNGRITRVFVWYPTNETGLPALYVSTTPLINYTSQFGAMTNVTVAEGKFPFILNNHPASGETALLGQNSQEEILASHGFIVLSYIRPVTNNTTCTAVYNDPKLLINLMLDKSANVGGSTLGGVDFLDRLDPNRIGIAGYSTGAIPAMGLAGGNASQSLTSDARIKAIVLYEPAGLTTCNLSLTDKQNVLIPYLEMDGSPVIGLEGQQLFLDAVNALPRIRVHTPDVVHSSYATSACYTWDQLRETSFARQTANSVSPLIDPTRFTVPAALDQGVGALAFTFWNLDGNPAVATGGNRQFCNRTGVNSAYILLDSDNDGITDIPPYNCTGPLISGQTCNTITVQNHPTGEQMEHLVYHYSVSFWKVFLEGDGRYNRFLTPGYAKKNEPNTIVTKIEE